MAPATLTVEGQVSKGGCEPIHDEHSPDGHVGHSLHPALGGPGMYRSWNCHGHTLELVYPQNWLPPSRVSLLLGPTMFNWYTLTLYLCLPWVTSQASPIRPSVSLPL